MEFVLFASAGMAQPSGLLAIAPYAIILGIFYFLILLPMNKRQKKVQEFQSSLKVGDKVITTSGIYGQVTRVEREVGPAAGRRTRPHRVRAHRDWRLPGSGARRRRRQQLVIMKNIRWKVFTVIGVFVVFFLLGVYPILANRYGAPAPQWLKDKALKLGLDLRGGVHLVLRVHTDEALRTSTTTTGEQLRAAASTAGVNVTSVNVTSPTSFRVEGVPQDRDAEFRRVADEITGANYDRNPGAGGAYDFTMRPNIANQMREQTVVQAQETIERRVNELGVSEPNISVYGNTGDQLLVQLPGTYDVARAKEIIRSTAQLKLKIVEAGPASSADALLTQHGGKLPDDMEVITGRRRRRARSTTW